MKKECEVQAVPNEIKQDITGQKFGKLTVIGFGGWVQYKDHRKPTWVCRCECGATKAILTSSLRTGKAKTCGCGVGLANIARSTTHGMARRGRNRSREYLAFHHAKNRCENRKNRSFADYGGRGIRFLFRTFEEFLQHLGPCPYGMSLDRIDTNGDYCIGNVKWSTAGQQTNNKRCNIILTVDGETKTLAEHLGESGTARYLRALDRLNRGWCHSCTVKIDSWGPRCRHRPDKTWWRQTKTITSEN